METKIQPLKTKHSEIWLDEEGILRVDIQENAELEAEEVKNCFDAYTQMGINKNNKVLQLMTTGENVTIDKEGRDYAAINGKDFFIASAIVSTSLATRLIVNFFNIFYKSQIVPFKMFDNEESAKRWLYKFKH